MATMTAWQKRQHLAEIIERAAKNAKLSVNVAADTAHHKQALYINGLDACGKRIYPVYFTTRAYGEKLVRLMKACKIDMQHPPHQSGARKRKRTR